MGLMIFLLTRGKKNIFHIYTFGDCEKIAAWSMVSPALLSLILGFIFTDYAMMFFIILLGLRVMWLSMKQLRPANR
jgi:maltodextrin utilization protein YvdJ